MSDSDAIRLHVAGRTDVGLVREHNEDNYTVVDLTSGLVSPVTEMRTAPVGAEGMVLVVCDGMGGAAAGETASLMAVETIAEVMLANAKKQPAASPTDPIARRATFARRLRDAAYTANRRIYDAAQRDPEKSGMGTTMTAVGVIDRHLVIAQVGDSRCYLLRDNVFTQLTRDQSLVNELLETGQITEEQAAMFEHSNVILQALGVQEDVEVLLSTVELRRGDRILVNSDGLSGVVSDEELGALAAVSEDVAEAARLLIEVARSAGGPDNITAIVARFDGEGLAEPSADEPPAAYVRWRLDEGDGAEPPGRAKQSGNTAPMAPISDGQSSEAPVERIDPARTFFASMMLFAIALISLVAGSWLYRSSPSGKCLVDGALGAAIRVDGLEVGARVRPGGTPLRLPPGHHRVALRDDGHLTAERDVDVPQDGSCTARFDGSQ